MRRERGFLGPQSAGGVVGLWGATSFIESIQYGSVTIAAGATSGTATITSVDMNRSSLVYGGFRSDNSGDGGTSAATLMCRIEFTNATTITAYRNASDATYGRVLTFCVVQYKPGVIRSVQRGTIDLTGVTSATATIDAVDTNRAMVSYLGNMSNFGGASNNIYGGTVTLTNGTTVTAATANNSMNGPVGYQVLEFF